MKALKIFFGLVVILTFIAQNASASLTQDFDSLGSNKKLVSRAKAYSSSRKVRVVQNRTVDRNWRLELGVSYGGVAGGNSYLSTNHFGGLADLHITPRFSLGVRYYESYNELTSEGQKVFREAENARVLNNTYNVPDVDVPLNTTLAVVSFYPIYGKLNLFDMGVAQFDFYGLAGYGQTKLESGNSPTLTAGGGVGIWLAQHFSARLELRWQGYKDRVYSGERDLNLTVASASLGFLL